MAKLLVKIGNRWSDRVLAIVLYSIVGLWALCTLLSIGVATATVIKVWW